MQSSLFLMDDSYVKENCTSEALHCHWDSEVQKRPSRRSRPRAGAAAASASESDASDSESARPRTRSHSQARPVTATCHGAHQETAQSPLEAHWDHLALRWSESGWDSKASSASSRLPGQ